MMDGQYLCKWTLYFMFTRNIHHSKIKIHKSKTCQFLKIMKITQIFICNNYKLFMVDFNNTHQVESNCMELPSMCAWCVEQFVMPLDLVHTCHGSISQMTYWLNCSQNIMHPNLHPVWQLSAWPPNMFQTSKLFNVVWPLAEGNV